MQRLGLLAVVALLGWVWMAQMHVWVAPHARKDETSVSRHYRSNPDGNPDNNWSYPESINSYTGNPAAGDPNLEQSQNINNFGSESPKPYQLDSDHGR